MSIINFENVCEKYRIKFIREGKVFWEEFCALEDVSFNVDKGEVLGVIGQNGAGKTTLLKLIAGVLLPDKGKVAIFGKVSILMELGAGFNPEFTGRENITLNARMYGVEESALDVQLEKIIAFADIGSFTDAPVKYYSQGMYMRLAFALAIFVEPDILLIDDILAVGDEEAQQKCLKKIFELKQSGKTIILVSHDMNMVNKLCDRVILFERGRIFRKGPASTVIPYYLETAGDKKGVAVLEKDKLKVIFNNGRINIGYDDNLITKGAGLFFSFMLSEANLWSSSSDLSWQVKSFLDNEIIAEGRNWEGILFLIWKMQVQESRLQWEIDIKDNAIKNAHINLFLVSDYKEWESLEKNGEFPLFAHKFNWKDLDFGNHQDNIVGLRPNPESNNSPFLTLEIQDEDCQFKLFNTGYEQDARVVQFSLFKNNSSAAGIKFFSQSEMFKEHIRKEKQKLFLKQQEEGSLLVSSRTISGGPLRLFADLVNKSLRLYFKDKEITKLQGLHGGFYTSQRWFNSSDARWGITKVSEEELILVLSYEPIILSQTWTLNFKKQNCLEIRIGIEANKQLLISNQSVKLELQDEYKNWATAYESGDFSGTQQMNDIIPVRFKNNKVSEVVLKSGGNDSIPVLSFEAAFEPDKQVLGIYKHGEAEKECICLNFSLIHAKKEEVVEQGKRYTYFEGQISYDKEIKLKDDAASVKIIDLNKVNLRFIFDRGKGKLFFGNKELTSGLGVYASMRSQGIWYDSYQAVWRLDYQDDKKITVSGDWPYIPVSQIWQIELISESLISWKIDMEIHEEIILEIEQSSLMLSCEYENWIIPRFTQGEFLDEYTQDYDILPFRFWYGNSVELAVKAKALPKIIFKQSGKNKFLRSLVENTDYLYRARILQYQKANNRKLLPGKYEYFEGLIGIGNEE